MERKIQFKLDFWAKLFKSVRLLGSSDEFFKSYWVFSSHLCMQSKLSNFSFSLTFGEKSFDAYTECLKIKTNMILAIRMVSKSFKHFIKGFFFVFLSVSKYVSKTLLYLAVKIQVLAKLT